MLGVFVVGIFFLKVCVLLDVHFIRIEEGKGWWGGVGKGRVLPTAIAV